MTDAYMTTAELAELVRAPIETVRFWRHIGKGPTSFKVGRRVLYDRQRVQSWLEQSEKADDTWNEPADLSGFIAASADAVRELADSYERPTEAKFIADLRETIARDIEANMRFEGVRAQRVIQMCAAIARSGRP